MRDIYIIRMADGYILRRTMCDEKEININVNTGEFYIDAVDGKYNYYINKKLVYIEEEKSDYIKLLEIRKKRDELLNESDIVYCNSERWNVMNNDKKIEWSSYKQELRDFPDTCDINNPIWPSMPIGD